jgi:vacuolar-type H+-ATPase subunit H
VSSINDIMDEEKHAQQLLRDAEQRAQAILTEARASAAAMLKRAQNDETLLKEATDRDKERIAALRAKILADCQPRIAETERLCESNLEAAVKLVTDDVLGANG